jgi:hypothetical protein
MWFPAITYLHWAVVNKNAVKGVQGLGGTIGMAKNNGGNTTANTASAVRDLHLLDWSNRFDKVFLMHTNGLISCLAFDLSYGLARASTSSRNKENREWKKRK